MNRKVLIGTSIILILAACSQETNPLCNCVEKSKELNNFSSILLNKESITEKEQKKLFQLREEIDSICKPFHDMGPEELYNMRNECIDPELIEMNK
jgi:hypothetical protein